MRDWQRFSPFPPPPPPKKGQWGCLRATLLILLASHAVYNTALQTPGWWVEMAGVLLAVLCLRK